MGPRAQRVPTDRPWCSQGSVRARADRRRALRLPGALPVEQDTLSFNAPRISRERTVDANDAVTGNCDREFVLGARTGDRAYRLWVSDTPRDLGIGNGLADGNLLKRPPHTLLEGGAAHVERKAQADSRFLNKGDNTRNQSLIVLNSADEMRCQEAILEVTDELVRVVSQQDGGDALLARSDEDGAERGLSDGEPYFLVRASGAVLRRGHAEHVR